MPQLVTGKWSDQELRYLDLLNKEFQEQRVNLLQLQTLIQSQFLFNKRFVTLCLEAPPYLLDTSTLILLLEVSAEM